MRKKRPDKNPIEGKRALFINDDADAENGLWYGFKMLFKILGSDGKG